MNQAKDMASDIGRQQKSSQGLKRKHRHSQKGTTHTEEKGRNETNLRLDKFEKPRSPAEPESTVV